MAYKTVGHVVAALADSFSAGLECYAGWRQRQRRRNNYHTRSKADAAAGEMCATIASLAISKLRIEEAFANGADVLGDEFISGDAACHDLLLGNLGRLRECIQTLETAAGIENRPLPLSELIRVSEAVRVSSLAALHKQYQRIVVGRLAPRALSPSSATTLLPSLGDGDVKSIYDEAAQTQKDYQSASSETSSCSQSHRNREPPSPPLTPTVVAKGRPDDDEDLISIYAQSTTSFASRPQNSVFRVFCPEAVKYQVDVGKLLPAKGTRCRCDYDWTRSRANDMFEIVLKDGFHITPRFLGKSHCKNGFGCVLCTSSGTTEIFGSVDDLKAHIDSSHTKWQLLHDRDLTGR